MASPSKWTVQAPHSAMPQPNLVPVRPRVSRRTQSNGVSSATSTARSCPLTVRLIMIATTHNYSRSSKSHGMDHKVETLGIDWTHHFEFQPERSILSQCPTARVD